MIVSVLVVFTFVTKSNKCSIMSDEPKIAEDYLVEALDLMISAGWVKQYAQNIKTGFAVQWTQKGENGIRAIFATIKDLDPKKLNRDVWWSVMTVANQIFGPNGKGVVDLDTTEL